jgi:hypothetical protein
MIFSNKLKRANGLQYGYKRADCSHRNVTHPYKSLIFTATAHFIRFSSPHLKRYASFLRRKIYTSPEGSSNILHSVQ